MMAHITVIYPRGTTAVTGEQTRTPKMRTLTAEKNHPTNAETKHTLHGGTIATPAARRSHRTDAGMIPHDGTTPRDGTTNHVETTRMTEGVTTPSHPEHNLAASKKNSRSSFNNSGQREPGKLQISCIFCMRMSRN